MLLLNVAAMINVAIGFAHLPKSYYKKDYFSKDMTYDDLELIESTYQCCFGEKAEGAREGCMCDIKEELIHDEKFVNVDYNLSDIIKDYDDSEDKIDEDINGEGNVDCYECLSFFESILSQDVLMLAIFLGILLEIPFIVVFFITIHKLSCCEKCCDKYCDVSE